MHSSLPQNFAKISAYSTSDFRKSQAIPEKAVGLLSRGYYYNQQKKGRAYIPYD